MAVLQICRREVDLVDTDESAWAAAERMVQRGAGSLVVVNQQRRPIGIVTDRDLVVKVMAAEKFARTTRVRDIMTSPVIMVLESDSVSRAYEVTRASGIRHLPVVDPVGRLVGILSLDEILSHLTRDPASVYGAAKS